MPQCKDNGVSAPVGGCMADIDGFGAIRVGGEAGSLLKYEQLSQNIPLQRR